MNRRAGTLNSLAFLTISMHAPRYTFNTYAPEMRQDTPKRMLTQNLEKISFGEQAQLLKQGTVDTDHCRLSRPRVAVEDPMQRDELRPLPGHLAVVVLHLQRKCGADRAKDGPSSST